MKIGNTFSSIALLGLSLAALVPQLAAQSVSANTTLVSLSAANGATTVATQALTLTVTGGGGQTLSISAAGFPWLRVVVASQVGCQSPVVGCNISNPPSSINVTVQADPALVPQNSTASGAVTLTLTNASSGSVQVPVTFQVGTSGGGGGSTGVLVASPTQLNFSGLPGSAGQTQIVSISNTGNPVNYTVNSSQAWLTTNVGSGQGVSPGALNVTASAVGLAANTYSGTLTLTPTGGGQATTILVNLVVSSTQQFQVNPSALSFSYISGSGSANPNSNLTIGVTTGSAVAYTLTTIYGQGQSNWLTTNPLNGGTTGTSTVPTNVSVTANGASLAIGTYTATLRFTGTGISTVDIPITLVVTSAPTFVVSPTPLSISVQPNTVAQRTLSIGTSNNATVNFSVTPPNPAPTWLTIAGSPGTTPGAVTIGVNPGSLAVGTYSAILTVASSTPGVLSTTVTVNMTVTTNQIVTFAPTSLNFNFVGGGAAPASQSVQLGLVPANPPQSASVGAVPDVQGQTWLSATLSSPSGQLITGNAAAVVTVNTTGLANGTYTGKVQIFVFGSVANSSIDIPVSLTVSNSSVIGNPGNVNPTVVLSQGQFTFNATPGGIAPDQTLILTSNNPTPINYTLSTNTSWLSVLNPSGTTPGSAIVRPTAGNLTAGTYTGQVILSAPGASNNGLGIPVTFTINAANQLQTSPSGFSFDYVAQSGVFPSAKTLQLTSSTGATIPVSANVTTNTGGSWLSVSPLSVNTAGQMVISINSTILQGLPVGSYSANISLQATGALNPTVNIPVSLNITGTSGNPNPGATQLILGPNPMNFYSNVGGSAPSQVLDINTQSGTSANYSLTFSTTTGGNWLSLSPNSGATPGQAVVTANTSSLSAGTYNGSITITSVGATNSGTSIPVTLTVSNQTNLVANPAGITVNYAIGGAAIPARFLTLSTTTGAAIPISVTTTSANNFLSVISSNNSTPATISVSINPAGLAAGVYSGTIFVSGNGAGNSPLNLPVTLIVTGAGSGTSQLSLSPNSLSFFAQPNGTPPQQRAVQVSSTGSSISYSVSSNQTWLLAGPGSGTTPGTITVGVSPVGLAAGSYSGNVTVTGGGSTVSLLVTLEITNNPLLQLGQQSVTFNYQTGQSLPSPRPILVTASNGSALSTSVTSTTSSGGNWLLVSPSNLQTPGAFAISLANSVVSTLAAGTYTGTVTVNASGAANANATINVTLNVSSTALLTMSTTPATFNAQFGGTAPPTQTRQITSTSGQLNVSVSTSTNGGSSWLSANINTNTTPATLTIGTTPSGLGTGVYTGSVTVTSGNTASALVIPITLNVSSLPLISVDKSELIYGGGGNSGTQPQTLQITSSSTNFNYTVQANVTNSPTNWLSVGTVNGVTPSNLVVTVNPALLGDGTYFGTIVISAPGSGNSPLVIPVTLTVNQATALLVNPASLTFTQIQGGPLPAQQPVQVTSQLPSAFNVTSAVQTPVGGNWLVVNQSGGITNGFLQVSLNNTASSLPPGTYTATITVFGPNSPNSVPITVTLNVVGAVAIQVAPASLSFNGRVGQPNPPTQTLQVTPVSTATVPVSYNVTSDASWLTATPVSGTTPGTLTVTASTTGLTAGSYTGRLSITPTGSISVGQATVVTVTFQVDQVTAPNITGFANAAFVPGPLSPGMIITLVGTNLGPTTAVQGQVVGGRFTTSLSGVRVLFDGIAAPVLYASSTQINAVVPYSLAGRASSRMSVEYNNVVSTSLEPRIVDTAPGIFTTDGRQVAMFNQDGSYNSSANPAVVGSVVVLYVTGEGSTNPAGVDGEVIGSNLKRPIAAVRVRVGGIEVPAADILYAGSAPTLVSGLMQINFRLPANTPTGPNTSLEVIVGSAASQPGVVLAVR